MNNKGFGIVELFLFSAFTIFIIFTAYTYFTHLVGDILYGNSNSSYNYVNPYTKYYKDGTISKVDNKIKTRGNKTITSDNYSYLEEELSNASREYYNDNYSNANRNDILYIKSSTLINNGYIDNIIYSADKSVCEGYTVVNNNTYKSFIKCPSYTTSGYDY